MLCCGNRSQDKAMSEVLEGVIGACYSWYYRLWTQSHPVNFWWKEVWGQACMGYWLVSICRVCEGVRGVTCCCIDRMLMAKYLNKLLRLKFVFNYLTGDVHEIVGTLRSNIKLFSVCLWAASVACIEIYRIITCIITLEELISWLQWRHLLRLHFERAHLHF